MMKYDDVNPTVELYAQLMHIADHFNHMLFGGTLPQMMFTLQRERHSAGYFSAGRWQHSSGKSVSEIALNSAYFANRSLLQLFQTIVHEQCHLWQHQYGAPSRPGYHNAEWAKKMDEVGLVPSSTGKPGGKKTGQKMADYPASGGKFILACVALVKEGFGLSWIDKGFDVDRVNRSFVDDELELEEEISAKLFAPVGNYFNDVNSQVKSDLVLQKRKVKYFCDSCQANVWGKKGLKIMCMSCEKPFVAVE